MYRNCIFCSADFGTNQSVEAFPVGRQIAFDGWRGRLWAVCGRCSRWNLAPLEERWEAVEEAEKLFRDARLRVQSENIGIARLPDGTRLIRVGQVVPGELAAWRYGRQLLHRRKRYFVAGGVTAVAGVAAYSGLAAMGFGFGTMWIGWMMVANRVNRKVLHRLGPDDDPAGKGVAIRRWHVDGMKLVGVRGDDLLLEVRDAHREDPGWRGEVNPRSRDITTISGPQARAVLARAMVYVNKQGASRDSLREADRILTDAGSAERVLRDAASGGAALGKKAGRDTAPLAGAGALAFEMALNEEAERRVLKGELAVLEAAWREAEEIAAIADSLPGEAALNRLLDRLGR